MHAVFTCCHDNHKPVSETNTNLSSSKLLSWPPLPPSALSDTHQDQGVSYIHLAILQQGYFFPDSEKKGNSSLHIRDHIFFVCRWKFCIKEVIEQLEEQRTQVHARSIVFWWDEMWKMGAEVRESGGNDERSMWLCFGQQNNHLRASYLQNSWLD